MLLMFASLMWIDLLFLDENYIGTEIIMEITYGTEIMYGNSVGYLKPDLLG